MLKRPRLPTRREPRQSRAVATRSHILTAAAKALREEGGDVGMTRIAELAGYGIGTVYEYFPNRRSLLCELMHQICEDELAAVAALVPTLREGSVSELVGPVLALLVEWAADHRVLTRVLATEVLPTLPPEELEDFVPIVAAMLAQQLRTRAEHMRAADAELAAYLCVNAVEANITALAIEHPEWFDRPELLTELVALVEGYLLHERRARVPVSSANG